MTKAVVLGTAASGITSVVVVKTGRVRQVRLDLWVHFLTQQGDIINLEDCNRGIPMTAALA